ncbi:MULTISPECIES: hypothetical protein [Enterobacteriaceae]|jgi:hypothetical protein|uniref:Uncharacterized protein n=3 Tax=Enterobacteriaceae TaxID=543 RepID=A0ABW1Q1X5_9ENTR|nr:MULTISPECIES: hypothetical protein [Enterobacteriaceae]AUU91433.1 hypothetical protein C2U55_21320 [Enterobacteriaceae bacterium ENNIH3]AUV08550.1 hypothetical protein C2U52_20955 [Enterobacteriaceae bacterium ENNIH2]MBS6736816.1 hypothetical protein [Enterobacteriaceae bacterium]MDU7255354.1 hypothetical protein [Escherichia coli]MDU7506329.1 hypothetical protein [Clostridia bacterium]PTA96132.1 hypothetical protein C9415_08250 [Kluyvera sp. Nf5]PWF50132.1 hypothetical protein BHT19_0003
MSIAKAHSLKQVYQMLNSGKYSEIELAFDVDADAFFQLSTEYCDDGAKITRHENHFVIKLKKVAIPELD